MDKRVKDTLLTLAYVLRTRASTILSMLYASALMTEIRSSPSASTYIRKLPKYQTSQDNVQHCMCTRHTIAGIMKPRYLIKIARYPLKKNRLIAGSLISCIMPLKVNPFHGFSFHPL